MIKKKGNSYILYTHDGSRKLGTHMTKKGAMMQEKAIYASKSKRSK